MKAWSLLFTALVGFFYFTPLTQSSTPNPSSSEPPANTGFGYSKLEAIEVCAPQGVRGYILQLRCPEGQSPDFKRGGNVGPRNEPKNKEDEEAVMRQIGSGPKQGEKDFHAIDAYELTCPQKTDQVYFDMYHCGAPEPALAPLGFTLEKPKLK